MTEIEARAALRAYVTPGQIEQWIADQWWEPVAGGWRVRGQFQGWWSFRIEPAPGGVRVVMYDGTGEPPTTWVAPTR